MKVTISQKILKVISLSIAILVLCGTVVYSQQSQKKKDPSKPKNNIFNTSKSGLPPEENTSNDPPKKEKPTQNPDQKEIIKPDKIFPSTKAPMTP